MRPQSVAVVAVFTAATIGSNFALAQFPDVKLLDTLVFICSFVFGLGTGAVVAVLAETIWSLVSPWGVAGSITPFLVVGELLFAVAGWAASKVWGNRISAVSPTSIFIGAVMAICAFAWDFETNAATALLYNWPQLTVTMLVGYELQGAVFAFAHEVSDFVLGMFLVPVTAAVLIPRLTRRRS